MNSLRHCVRASVCRGADLSLGVDVELVLGEDVAELHERRFRRHVAARDDARVHQRLPQQTPHVDTSNY